VKTILSPPLGLGFSRELGGVEDEVTGAWTDRFTTAFQLAVAPEALRICPTLKAVVVEFLVRILPPKKVWNFDC
jgi:hypothetical protein